MQERFADSIDWRKVGIAALTMLAFLGPRSVCAQAGDDIDPQVHNLLAAGSAANRAWGAYLAGTGDEQLAAPRLIELLKERGTPETEEDRFEVRAILDALVLLQASVDADVLLPHARRFSKMSVIIASQSDAQGDPVLLDILSRDGSGLSWEAAANLLTTSRCPGAAAHMLGRLQTEIRIHVVDPGRFGGGFGDTISSGFGCGGLDVPARFPPVAIYELFDEKVEGAVLLARGTRPIYFVRKERLGGKIGVGSRTRSRERDEHARSCLATLAGLEREELGLERRFDFTMEYVDDAGFLARVRDERESVLAAHDRLIEILERDGLLLDGEAETLSPVLTLSATDHRKSPPAPLPSLPEALEDR